MYASCASLLARLPGPIGEQWPAGERFAPALAHGAIDARRPESDACAAHRRSERIAARC